MDGVERTPGELVIEDKTLVIADLPDAFTLEMETVCAPAANTALSGLYVSNDMFCTQCEAEGFRRITYFLDRPRHHGDLYGAAGSRQGRLSGVVVKRRRGCARRA